MELLLGMEAQAFNTSPLKAEAGGALWVLGQLGEHKMFQVNRSEIEKNKMETEMTSWN